MTRSWSIVVMVMMMGAALVAGSDEPAKEKAPSEPSIELRPGVLKAGDNLTTVIRIPGDEGDFRSLVVAVESPEYFSSTERQLRGARSPRSYRFTWHMLPASEYVVTVELRDGLGVVSRAERSLVVRGDGQQVPCDVATAVADAACEGSAQVGRVR